MGASTKSNLVIENIRVVSREIKILISENFSNSIVVDGGTIMEIKLEVEEGGVEYKE